MLHFFFLFLVCSVWISERKMKGGKREKNINVPATLFLREMMPFITYPLRKLEYSDSLEADFCCFLSRINVMVTCTHAHDVKRSLSPLSFQCGSPWLLHSCLQGPQGVPWGSWSHKTGQKWFRGARRPWTAR